MTTKLIGPIQHKRGTTAKIAQYTGAPGEIVINMEDKTLSIHDGITQGGHALNAGASNLLVWDSAVTDDLGTHNEDATVSVSVKARSAFGDEKIVYTVTAGTLPAGLTINQATGMLEGTMPNLVAVTPFTFTLEAADGVSTISRTFTITVNADNDSPVWQTASDLGILGMLYGTISVQLVANDPDGTLTYSVSGGSLPGGLSLSSAGLLSGDVVADGQTYNFTVTASDGVNNVQRTFSAMAGITAGAVIGGDIAVAQLSNGDWLLVAPAMKRAMKKWGLYGTDTSLPNITSAGAVDPNTGTYNTDVLTSAAYNSKSDGQGSVGAPAAKWCRDQGYDLPNKEELNLIYQNRAAIDMADESGGAATLAYIAAHATPLVWSSTEHGRSPSWNQRFSDGNQNNNNKNNEFWAVPARR